MSDLPPTKKRRGGGVTTIGDVGPMIDKPGKGAFFATDLHAILANRGIPTRPRAC